MVCLSLNPSALRLAVIGSGLASAPHFRSIEDLADRVEVLWIHSRTSAQRATVPVRSGIEQPCWRNAQKTSRLEDILEDPAVQAVLVLTPPNTHLEIVQRLAHAGKHVLVEKPLDITLQRATALVEACEQNGVCLAVMLQHRLRAAALDLAERVHTGELGSLVSAAMSVRWWRPQSYYDEPGRGTFARDGGGVLITQAIHTLDLLLALTGLPTRVTGHISTSALHRMEAEDTAAALLHYDNGAVAVLQATTAAYPGFSERIELNFTQGSATLEGGLLQVAYTDGRRQTVGASGASGGGADPMAFDHAAHRTVLDDFVRAVQTGRPPAITGRSALGAQRVIEAITRSSAAGTAISL